MNNGDDMPKGLFTEKKRTVTYKSTINSNRFFEDKEEIKTQFHGGDQDNGDNGYYDDGDNGDNGYYVDSMKNVENNFGGGNNFGNVNNDLNYGNVNFNNNITKIPPPRNGYGRKIRNKSRNKNKFGRKNVRNTDPKLNAYYELENEIKKKMLRPKNVVKRATVTNIWGGNKKTHADEKNLNNYREIIHGGYDEHNKKNISLAQKQKKTNLFDKNTNFAKNKKDIFFKNSKKKNLTGKKKIQSSSNFDISLKSNPNLMNSTPAELEHDLQVKSHHLRDLEHKLHNLNSNTNNLTHVKKNIKNFEEKTRKMNSDNFNLEGENRLLNEILFKNRSKISDLDIQITRVPPLLSNEKVQKEKFIKDIKRVKEMQSDLNKKMDDYYFLNKKKLDEMRVKSQSHMNDELENIKINVMNYDGDLKQWLNFFIKK